MLDAAFMHRRTTTNIGDLACSPGLYFDFGVQQFFDFNEKLPACKLAIFGGGQVFRDCFNATIYKSELAQKRVVWGVGISPKHRDSFEFDMIEPNSALVSTRNWGIRGCEFVPCPTAMSPLFDSAPDPVHDVVLFNHDLKSAGLKRVAGIPTRNNHDGTMKDAISFIASGNTVVTNSYHGTYWAMCLGRRVICVPFNDKFKFFRENPIMAGPDDWVEKIKLAERREGVLDQARKLNTAFYERVQNLI